MQDRGRRSAGTEPQAVDVDGHPADVAIERVAQRVTDRRVDLAGDLGDRNAVRDGQVEVDVDRVAEMDGDARLGEPDPFEEALVRAARRIPSRRTIRASPSAPGRRRPAG